MIDTSSDALAGLGLRSSQQPQARKELGQEDFLTLMLTQFKNQDPLKPMANGEFLGQIAQFSTVSGIQSLQQSFADFASTMNSNQALQAATLMGREAMVEADALDYDGSGAVQGAAMLTASSADTVIDVTDEAGRLLRQLHLGSQGAGLAPFSWDGLDAQGQQVPAGRYRFNARAENPGGASEAIPTLIAGQVQRVALGGSDGVTLNLAGLGLVPLSEVRQIQ